MEFYALIVALPLGAYLLMLGLIRLRRRVLVTTGGRDTFALALAISGLVAVGPGELFFPATAATALGTAVWPLLAMLYLLTVALVVLYQRPRLVVYGLGDAPLAAPLLRACRSIDAASRLDERSGTISLPTVGLHLRLVRHRSGDSADVELFETDLRPDFWRSLLTELRREVAREPAASVGLGLVWATLGAILLGWAATQTALRPTEIAEGFRAWLSR
ncbi:MAG: hypothetical protein EA381_10370 [Planctomycetaceae bacterium]|nr:MAG: hypothetical protein EA381_10370 [Planctomycetaceae bacterium]